MIQTVPKCGYRFVAPVKTADAATALILREDAAGKPFVGCLNRDRSRLPVSRGAPSRPRVEAVH